MRLLRLPLDHCPQLAAMAPPESDARRRQADHPFVDEALSRFAHSFETEDRVIEGENRRLLRANGECRQLLIPPQASMEIGFGIDRERLRGRRVRPRFYMTIDAKGELAVLVDEAVDSNSEQLWVQQTIALDAYAYETVEMCITSEIEGAWRGAPNLAVWANPTVNSKLLSSQSLPAIDRITEQERKLREKQLKAIGYFN